jgi:hypothetical protein
MSGGTGLLGVATRCRRDFNSACPVVKLFQVIGQCIGELTVPDQRAAFPRGCDYGESFALLFGVIMTQLPGHGAEVSRERGEAQREIGI